MTLSKHDTLQEELEVPTISNYETERANLRLW